MERKEENEDSVLTKRSGIQGRRVTIRWSDKGDEEGIKEEERRDINVIKERNEEPREPLLSWRLKLKFFIKLCLIYKKTPWFQSAKRSIPTASVV
jgi:hypothetical protein